MASFRLLDAGRRIDIGAQVTDHEVWINAYGLEALGWVLKPEGLCRGSICLPVSGKPGLISDDRFNLEPLADLLGRPLALSVEERAAYLGLPFSEFGKTVGSLEAPNFELPDADGRLHSLAEHRGSKVLLAVWASW